MSLPSPDELRERLALSRTFKYKGSRLASSEREAATTEASQFDTWQEFEVGPALENPLGIAGTVIDQKYRLHSFLGVGGMGSVYRVRHLLLNKEMALKTLRRAAPSCVAWQRFQREAQAIARLNHANIVQVYDCGICEGNVPYYTMELLRGQPLSDKLKKYGKLSLENALPIFKSVAAALSHAHCHDIVHRDIKPANIFLDHSQHERTVVKVVDFGLAKLAATQDYDGQATTGSGIVFGSPLYMSPEQATADETDWRTDIYSFGCAFFETLTGRPPFIGRTAFETLQMHLLDVPPQLVEANRFLETNQQLEKVMSKLLAKDVALRYQSFDDVLRDLARLERSSTCDATHPMLASFPDEEEDVARAGLDGQVNVLSVSPRMAAANGLVSKSLETRFISSTALLLTAIMVSVLSLIFGPNMHAVQASKAAVLRCFPSSPPHLLPKGTYYSSLLAAGGRRFYFPNDSALGYFSVADGPARLAEGVVFVPQGSDTRLEVSAELGRRPELLQQFRPDDITILSCREFANWNDKFVEGVTSHLKTVKVLELTGCDLGNDCIVHLNRLKDLMALSIGDTNITGTGLAGLHTLRQLQLLDACQTKDISAALQCLKGSTNLEYLNVEDCFTSDADIANIGTMSALTFLGLNHNKISQESFKHLSLLKELNYLGLDDTQLGPDAIGIIHDFKKLRRLRMDTKYWSASDIEKLKKAVPAGCTIEKKKTFPSARIYMTECWALK